jgi:hypothetical protein
LLISDSINQLFKSNPAWRKLMGAYLPEDTCRVTLAHLANDLKRYRDVFKPHGFDLDHCKKLFTLEDVRHPLERLTDSVRDILLAHRQDQLLRSLKTEKYRHLFDRRVEFQIKQMMQAGLNAEVLKGQVFNKLARYQESDELLKALETFSDANINWSLDSTIKEISSQKGATLVGRDNNCLVIKVEDFAAAEALGKGSSWCISTSASQFSTYTRDSKQQYYILDFDKPATDVHAMIGVTLKDNGQVYVGHRKDDREIKGNVLRPYTGQILRHIRPEIREMDDALLTKYDGRLSPKLDVRMQLLCMMDDDAPLKALHKADRLADKFSFTVVSSCVGTNSEWLREQALDWIFSLDMSGSWLNGLVEKAVTEQDEAFLMSTLNRAATSKLPPLASATLHRLGRSMIEQGQDEMFISMMRKGFFDSMTRDGKERLVEETVDQDSAICLDEIYQRFCVPEDSLDVPRLVKFPNKSRQNIAQWKLKNDMLDVDPSSTIKILFYSHASTEEFKQCLDRVLEKNLPTADCFTLSNDDLDNVYRKVPNETLKEKIVAYAKAAMKSLDDDDFVRSRFGSRLSELLESIGDEFGFNDLEAGYQAVQMTYIDCEVFLESNYGKQSSGCAQQILEKMKNMGDIKSDMNMFNWTRIIESQVYAGDNIALAVESAKLLEQKVSHKEAQSVYDAVKSKLLNTEYPEGFELFKKALDSQRIYSTSSHSDKVTSSFKP